MNHRATIYEEGGSPIYEYKGGTTSMMYVSGYNPGQSALAQQHRMQSGQGGISHGYPVATSLGPGSFSGGFSGGQQGMSFSPVQSFTDPMRTAVMYSFNPMGWSST